MRTSDRGPHRTSRTRHPCAAASWRRRRRRGSCWDRRTWCRRPHRARSSSGRCTTSTPRASRPSRRTRGRPEDPPACRSARRRRRPPHGPASRRCCNSPSAPRRRVRSASRSTLRSGSSCAAIRRSGHRRAAWTRRTPCAAPADRASRARRGSSPCARTGPGRGRRRGSPCGTRRWTVSRCRTWESLRGSWEPGRGLQAPIESARRFGAVHCSDLGRPRGRSFGRQSSRTTTSGPLRTRRAGSGSSRRS